MPFRRRFDCLWCGRTWETRADGDLEGWAALCPECLGKADDNGFLRGRLRTALRDRSAAAAADRTARGDWEDWYLRRGRFARGPVYDGPWSMELDEVTRWVDGLHLAGVLVELGAGMGWWTALLAEKGELWLYDDDPASLDAARTRLMAHGLLAHLHQRHPLAPADREVDTVFAAYLLGRAQTQAELDRAVAVARSWLKPGGSFVFVEALPGDGEGPIVGPAGPLLPRDPEWLGGHLVAGGFEQVEVGATRTAFVFGEAVLAL
ncbi:MAG: class I SAM-dependent methyltransferase [Chloroflexota bacterium]|jgi:SAM-dependent methyltransferase